MMRNTPVRASFFLAAALFLAVAAAGCKSSSQKTLEDFRKEQANAPQSAKEIEVPTPTKEEIDRKLSELQNVKTEEYKIGLGDKFNFSVYGEEDMRADGLIVLPDGSVTIKLIGEVPVAGKPITSARKEIEAKLKKYFLYPHVTLSPYELHGSKFTILGKVVQAGNYPLDEKTRITDTIALAGGLSTGYFQDNTIEMADLQHAYISRKGEILPVDFVKAIRDGDRLNNIPVRDGDYIYIPSSMSNEVYVLGEVNSPGYIGYRENMTLIQAIAYARDINEVTAKTSSIIIVRGSLVHPKVFKVSIDDIRAGRSQDFVLKPGDIVYVPRTDLDEWNDIVQKIKPTVETINTMMDIRQKAIPLRGGLLPRHYNEWINAPSE